MNPAEKKAIAYRKDHRNEAEYPHLFRRNFPRHRAKANRKYRHAVRRFLTENEQAVLEGEETVAVPIRRDTVRKRDAVPLGEWIKQGQEARVWHTTRKYFSQHDASLEDKERFARFLTLIIAENSDHSHAVARYFNRLLGFVLTPTRRQYPSESSRREWFEAFLQDFPAWREPLRNWIEKAMDYGRSN